jgi:hypothetical protein
MLELDDSDAIRGRTADIMTLPELAMDDFPIIVIDNLYNRSRIVSDDDKSALLSVLHRDITNLSIENKYFPQKAARIIIQLPRLIEDSGRIGQPSYERKWTKDWVSVAKETGIRANMPFLDNAENPLYANFGFSERTMHWLRFYITDNYVETLAFLESKGMGDLFDGISRLDESQITGIHAQHVSFNSHPSMELYFSGYMPYDFDTRSILGGMEISPQAYLLILEHARTHYYTALGGYRLHVAWNEFGISRRVVLFLPIADAAGFSF